MSSRFTTEIGRMRSEEMILRGLRYQQLEAARRNSVGSSHDLSPSADTRMRRSTRRRSALKVPAVAALVMTILIAFSTVAFAYPAATGGKSASRSAGADLTTVQIEHVTFINGGWILGTALAALLLISFFEILRRYGHGAART